MIDKKRKDRRILRTRKLLQTALLELLRQKPLAKIHIKEIVEVANVARPTFYQHFETKEQLLFSHVDDVLEKIRIAVFVDRAHSDTVNFHQLLVTSFEQWKLHEEELLWVAQLENKDRLIAVLRTHILTIKQEYEKFVTPAPVLPKFEEYAINYVSGGLYMLIKTWLETGAKEPPETMATLAGLLISSQFFQMRFADTQGAQA